MKMIDPGDGMPLLCMWDDCQRRGDTQHQVVNIEPHDVPQDLVVFMPRHQAKAPRVKRVIYLFCSERHKMLYVNSHKDFGRLPLGSRGTIL